MTDRLLPDQPVANPSHPAVQGTSANADEFSSGIPVLASRHAMSCRWNWRGIGDFRLLPAQSQ